MMIISNSLVQGTRTHVKSFVISRWGTSDKDAAAVGISSQNIQAVEDK